MSTQPPATPPAKLPDEREIRIVSHSNLFYWWPVWAVGFIMALYTYFTDTRLAILPADTHVEQLAGEGDVKKYEISFKHSATDSLKKATENQKDGKPPFRMRVVDSKHPGAIFAVVVLLVIAITNAPLRGMWSVLIIVVVILGAIIFALAGWWTGIVSFLSTLNGIHIDTGGYVFISSVLFAMWVITVFFFDRQIYMIFTPGQLKVRLEIGGGEKAYDTAGMTVEKQRSDLFRHWILGLGSGDLVVNTAGAQVHHFDLPNVLFISRKVEQIEDMLREKAVVRGSR